MTEDSQANRKARLVREGGKLGAMVLVLVGLMLWLSGAFLSRVEPQPPKERREAGAHKTAKVERHRFPLVVEQVGTLRAKTEAQVSSRIMAQVREIHIAEGDQVLGPEVPGHEGTVLAVLEDADIQAKLRQALSQVAGVQKAVEAAKAQAESARANRERAALEFRRTDSLRRDQAATGQQWEAARAQKDMAEAQFQAASHDIARLQAQKAQTEAAVAEARSFLEYSVIRAPFSGKVLKKMVNVGDMAAPGQPLFFLDSPSQPELHTDLSESLLPHLREGMELGVRIDAIDRTVSGKLREIVPKSDPATRTIRIKVEIQPESGLVNGLFARVRIPYGSYEGLVAPTSAIRRVGQLQMVEVVGKDGHPMRRFVTIGQSDPSMTEVLSGLDAGEEVIVP
ncbi:MAG: efflux RND transporter periplasmic adaptor subunit [Syntrophobacteraceae bacterium]